MNKAELRKEILQMIRLPDIPDREFSVSEFGVKPDSGQIQTELLQRAVDAVSLAGGGRLTLPEGVYRTGALELKSGVELHLAGKGTVLKFVNEHPERHYPVVFSHWEASPCMNYSSLIYACEAHDIALTGAGTLDGGADAEHWWNWHHQVENAWSADKPDLQLADRKELRRMNLDGVPVSGRVFGPGHYLRPNFVQIIRCERVLFRDFTLNNSPMWQMNPVFCRSLTMDGVTLQSHGPNNDGCDPESCTGVHIRGCKFDTGDDCISLKSGRDRDGRETNTPCSYVLIENNEFADGHGGIALGSEMSGGIHHVLAVNNRFSSPNLTYALRFKSNARRGGKVEEIILADSVMDHVHGAAVHGTMLYEDGRNGDDLPVFRNITVENVTAHGGDYGIFLEAFPEVPITGLVLKDIAIDGVRRELHGMNWSEPTVENVVINGKRFPRPGRVRILGVPAAESTVHAAAENCMQETGLKYYWQTSADGKNWKQTAEGQSFRLPEKPEPFLRAEVCDVHGNAEVSGSYRVLDERMLSETPDYCRRRLLCRGMGAGPENAAAEPVTRALLAEMMRPLVNLQGTVPETRTEDSALSAALRFGFLARDPERGDCPEGRVSRQEMATVAMQACGINYRNASSTMPVCADADQVGDNYGTNVARALYFGFMELGPDGVFDPKRPVTVGEAIRILDRVADFAGL